MQLRCIIERSTDIDHIEASRPVLYLRALIITRSVMSGGDNISKSFGEVPKLIGKENCVKWRHRITLALSLTRSSSFVLPLATIPYLPTSPSTPLSLDQIRANTDWIDRDHQVAAAILSTTEKSILTAHIHLLDVDTGRAQAVYLELVRIYGNTGAQYSFALGRKFIDSRCKEGEDVEAWVNEVQAQYRELKLHSFDLDALCVKVMLNGLPERFASFVDGSMDCEREPQHRGCPSCCIEDQCWTAQSH